MTVAELAQQTFANVGNRFELAETQESARSFDRVNRAKDTAENWLRVRVWLELDQVKIELIEILVALNEKLSDDILKIIHSLFLIASRKVPRENARLKAARGKLARDWQAVPELLIL